MKKLDESILFEIKQKFFNEIPHPKLIKKEITKISSNLDFIDQIDQHSDSRELNTYLNAYLTDLLKLKLAIANSKETIQLYTSLKELYILQNSMISKLASYVAKSDDLPLGHLKLSGSIDAFKIVQELKSTSTEESEISEYIWQEISNKNIEDFTVITNECLRAFKIKMNG